MSIFSKIKNRRIELNMSQEELAKKTGYKTKSAISRIESGQRDINQSQIEIFAKALDTTTEYLLGIQTKPKTIYETKNLVNLDELDIQPILHITNFLASCGNGIDFFEDEDNQEIIYLPTELVGTNTKNSWVMHTIGDSMNKRIPENSNIIVKQNDYYNNGDIVLYKITDNFAIKEYYLYADRIVLKPASYNPLHEQETYNFEDRDNGFEFPEILGKVTGFYGSTL